MKNTNLIKNKEQYFMNCNICSVISSATVHFVGVNAPRKNVSSMNRFFLKYTVLKN